MNHVIYNSRHLFYVCAKFIFLCLDMLSYNDPVFDTNLSSSLQTCDTMRIHMIFQLDLKNKFQVNFILHDLWMYIKEMYSVGFIDFQKNQPL